MSGRIVPQYNEYDEMMANNETQLHLGKILFIICVSFEVIVCLVIRLQSPVTGWNNTVV